MAFDHSSVSRWEREGEKVIRTLGLSEIKLVLEFIPISDATAVNSLNTRFRFRLKVFLEELQGDTSCEQDCSKSLYSRKIVDILRKNDVLDFSKWDWNWVVPAITSSPEVDKIARKIDADICTIFNMIPVHSWIRYLCGNEATVISTFLDAISNCRSSLAQYLSENSHSSLEDKVKLIAEALKDRHPLAIWIFETSQRNYDTTIDPTDALHFLSDPIKDLVATHEMSLFQTLKRLSFLSSRFKARDWRKSVGFSFLEAVEYNDPKAHAISITNIARKEPISSCVYDPAGSTCTQILGREWLPLYNDAITFLNADKESKPYILKLTELLIYMNSYRPVMALCLALSQGSILAG